MLVMRFSLDYTPKTQAVNQLVARCCLLTAGPLTSILVLIFAPRCAPVRAADRPLWTQFEMNRQDAGGRHLWTDAANWTRGVPRADLCVEIGDDHSGQALHCVIPAGCDAVCMAFELAEHARTQGTTLRLEKGARLTVAGSAILSKDRESWFYVDGTLRCANKRTDLRVGGPWGRPELNEPASCHLLVGPTGVVDAWFIGINTSYRAESAPSSPWGPRFFARSTGSEIVVDGGKLIARQGLRMSTCDTRHPGTLRLSGKATFTNDPESEHGVDIWCGMWEIHGGQAEIRVGDIEFWGNKFEGAINTKSNATLGSGLAILKLTGDGVSTVHARTVDFVDAAILDVTELKVPAGTYKVIDGTSVGRTNLRLCRGTDTNRWSLRFDEPNGDLLLTSSPQR